MISPYYILLFVTISSFVYGLIGFGDALILIPIITPIIGIQSAIVLTNFWGIFTSGFNLIQYRKFIDWKFVGKYLIAAVPAAIIGIFLIPYISGRILEIILGVFIVLFSIMKLYKYMVEDRKKVPTDTSEPGEEVEGEKKPKQKVPEFIIYLGGIANGFLASLISAAGPINVAVLESTGHKRESLIGNFSAILFPLALLRLPLYIINDVFPLDLWVIFLFAIPIILVFAKIGHLLTPKIPVKIFQIIVLFFLLVIGIKFFF